MKTYFQFRWGTYTSASEFRFWIGGQNLADQLILSAKIKKIEKSASKNKNPIKLLFLNWNFQSESPEKKVIPEKHEFGSCPFGILKKVEKKNQKEFFDEVIFSLFNFFSKKCSSRSGLSIAFWIGCIAY